MPNRCAPKVLIPSLLIIISRKLCVGLRPFGTELNRKRVSGMHRWQCACDFPLYSQLIGALILLSFPCSVLSANCLLLSFLFYPSSRLSLIIIIVTLLLIDFGLSFFLSSNLCHPIVYIFGAPFPLTYRFTSFVAHHQNDIFSSSSSSLFPISKSICPSVHPFLPPLSASSSRQGVQFNFEDSLASVADKFNCPFIA